MTNQLIFLEEKMKNCQACDLWKSRKQIVFGEGSQNPLIVLCGEAPGAEEDITGKPFVGQAGQKLDKILNYIGINRNDIYILNSVLCRPINNRQPRQEELDACRDRLKLQLEILKPKLIIALGKTAAIQLKGAPFKGQLSQFFYDKIKEPDGWIPFKLGDQIIKLLITFHPSFLLRSPKYSYPIALKHWNKVKNWLAIEENKHIAGNLHI